MNGQLPSSGPGLAPDAKRRIADACAQFDKAWIAGQRPRIEDVLPTDWPPEERLALFQGLLEAEFHFRHRVGEAVKLDEYLQRFPGQAEIVRAAFNEIGTVVQEGTPDPDPTPGGEKCAPPASLGRYRVTGELGRGTFGVVYQGYDDTLHRQVAIKVPRPEVVEQLGGLECYLREAEVLAALDHPHIVPVHDAGHTEDGLCFVVHGFIQGKDLRRRLEQKEKFTIKKGAQLVGVIAEALQHAHQKGIYHRDVKPANILVDNSGKPFLTDFGLAHKDEDFGKGSRFAGTVPYMSPEQARRESHRVDGRTDIFSLGVVLYELLTGQLPFRGTQEEILGRIASGEARPPRQVDPKIPLELERICLKAMARRLADRYTTAADLAGDLRAWLTAAPSARPAIPPAFSPPVEEALTPPPQAAGPGPIRIVPKGLRSFDAGDADFFLDLLPGPRDRHGLPEALRFWKTRLEETDPDRTLAVGLLYGPSGCGKSSLLKAGLLPRLARHVLAVYVEATPEGTERRLLRGVRKACPELVDVPNLVDVVVALRRGRGLEESQKVVLVLDQFEQWLHGKKGEEDPELVRALRQCDGGRVQCVVLVRDDFWMAISRFMRDLEIRLVEGENSAAVDLFPMPHAQKVLTAFGRAFAVLAESPAPLTGEQQQFVEQAVQSLAQEGKVICVRLALFAEMVKGKPWTPATLKEVGGMEGVGVTFLEETFSAPTSPPEHRYHQKAARAVLQALLPQSGTDIKGSMRTHAELLKASGYGSRPRDFDDLLRILDAEIRLITPTDPEGKEDSTPQVQPEVLPRHDGGPQKPEAPAKECGSPSLALQACENLFPAHYYQLTHDYLVPSLRDWLTRKQKETRRGRAELLLADRAAVWNSRPENRQLPSLMQWCYFRWLTRKKDWTPPQRKMMRKATHYHLVRGLVLAFTLVLLGWLGYETHGKFQAVSLRDQLLKANTKEVPNIVKKMDSYRRQVNPLLLEELEGPEVKEDASKNLHVRLALLAADPTQVEYCYERMLIAGPKEMGMIAGFLEPHKELLLEKLWSVVEKSQDGKESERLRAAAALARYDPNSKQWEKFNDKIVADLVLVEPLYLGDWIEAFKNVKNELSASLVQVFRDGTPGRLAERTNATYFLADFAVDEPEKLVDLLLDGDDRQFGILFPKVELQKEGARPYLFSVVNKDLQSNWKDFPPNATWKPISKDLEKQIKKANGLIADRFVLCPALPLEVIPLLAENLRGSDFRPALIRPVLLNGHVCAGVLWVRDGKEWQLLMKERGEVIRARDQMWRKTGFTPVSLAPHPRVEPGGPFYAGLWVRESEKPQKRDNPPEEVFQEVPGEPVPLSWAVKFFSGQDQDFNKPPVDWSAVLHSKPVAALALDQLDFDSWRGLPDKKIPKKHFALTATASLNLNEGNYLFEVFHNNGVRIYWDDKIVLERWTGNPSPTKEMVPLSAVAKGRHKILVEYFSGESGYNFEISLSTPYLGLDTGRRHLIAQVIAALGLEWPGTASPVVPQAAVALEVAAFDGSALIAPSFQGITTLSATPEAFEKAGTEASRLGYRPAEIDWIEVSQEKQKKFRVFWKRPRIPEEEWNRLAMAAVALFHLNYLDSFLDLWHHPEPDVRSHLLARLGILGSTPEILWKRFCQEEEVTARQTLLLALGEFGEKELPLSCRQDLLPPLFDLYRENPDSGIHGSVAWLLGFWDQREQLKKIDQGLQKRDQETARKGLKPPGNRLWYLNGQGQTMVIIPGVVEFQRGPPWTKKTDSGRPEERYEYQPYWRIGHSYAIAANEITRADYQRFLDELDPPQKLGGEEFGQDPDYPAHGMSWFRAAAYCNWLSKKEGIPGDQWCYLTNEKGKYEIGMKVKVGHRGLMGYRLPSQAEWEYACQGGKVTTWYFGGNPNLLGRYAWFRDNSRMENFLRVGSLRPNNLGLFDMLGNASEWCEDPFRPSLNPRKLFLQEDLVCGDDYVSITDFFRSDYGGNVGHEPDFLLSFRPFGRPPNSTSSGLGFRVARTIP